MTPGDWIQLGSLVALIVTLWFVALQTRHLKRNLTQVAHQNFIGGQNDLHLQYFRDDPDLLRWHLKSWGFAEEHEVVKDKHLFFALLKLDVHESAFLNHRAKLLGDDVWKPWEEVLKADFGRPEFKLAWQDGRAYYAKGFVDHVDRILNEPPTSDRAR